MRTQSRRACATRHLFAYPPTPSPWPLFVHPPFTPPLPPRSAPPRRLAVCPWLTTSSLWWRALQEGVPRVPAVEGGICEVVQHDPPA